MFSQSCVKVSASLTNVGSLAVRALDLVNCSLSVVGFVLVFNVAQQVSLISCRFALGSTKGCRNRLMVSEVLNVRYCQSCNMCLVSVRFVSFSRSMSVLSNKVNVVGW